MKTKLAIITINLNNNVGLNRTIESVISQTSKDFQFIVIDGGSNDGSTDLVEKYKSHFYYSISEKDKGIYEAMNKGIKHSTADYLLFLNSGDWLFNESVIEKVLPSLNDYDIISGDIDIFDKGIWHEMHSEEKVNVELFLRLSLYHQATFISKNLFEKYGLYDESFKSTGDYEFFIRVLLNHNATYKHIPFKVSKFVADGMSNNIELKDFNLIERRKSWLKHFHPNLIKVFEAYYELSNSNEINLAKRINKKLPF